MATAATADNILNFISFPCKDFVLSLLILNHTGVPANAKTTRLW